jgi:FtsH-binding integral membrane protein
MQPQQHNPYGHGPQYAPGVSADPRAQLSTGVEQFMIRVNAWMAAGVGLTGLAAFAVAQSQALLQTLFTGGMVWVTLFAPFVFVLIFASRLERMSSTAATVTFLAFSVIMGVSLAPVAIVYTGESIASVFAITAVTYGALAFWGFTTKRDLAPMGKFLFMVLIGMFVSGIVMLVMQLGFGMTINPVVFMIRAGIGVLLFAGLTAYDTQKIKQIYLVNGGAGNLAISGALTLYLDFINLFLFLLRLFGNRD